MTAPARRRARPLRGAWLGLALAALVLVAGCGIPAQSDPQAVAPDQIPEQLRATPSAPPATLGGTGITESVFMITTVGDSAHLVPVDVSFPNEPTPDSLVRQLLALAENAAALEEGVGNRVPPDLALVESDNRRDGVEVDGDLVRIRLNDGLQNVQGNTLKEALAQIVWTATQTGGVQRVQLLDEDDNPIPVEGTNDDGAKEIVRRSDFDDFAPLPE